MYSFMPNQFQLNQLKWQLAKCQVIDLTRLRLLRIFEGIGKSRLASLPHYDVKLGDKHI